MRDVVVGRGVALVLGLTATLAAAEEGAPFPPQCEPFLRTRTTRLVAVWGEYPLSTARGAGALAVTPDGRAVLVAEDHSRDDVDDALSLRHLRDGRVVWSVATVVSSLAITPDGRQALCAEATSVVVRDLETGRAVRELAGHEGPVHAIVLADGGRALTAGEDGTIREWELRTGLLLRTLVEGRPVEAIALTSDGRLLACGAFLGMSVWDLARAQKVALWTRPGEGLREELRGVVATADLAIAGTDGWDGERLTSSVTAWDLRTGEQVWSAELDRRIGHCEALALSPDGRRVAVATWGITQFDVATGRRLGVVAPSETAHAMAYTQGGARLLAAGRHLPPTLYDVEGGDGVRELAGHVDAVRWLSLSKDGRLALTGPDIGSDLRLRETASGASRLIPLASARALTALALTPDGGLVLVGRGEEGFLCGGEEEEQRNDTLWLLDVARGAAEVELQEPEERPVEALAVAPDGAFFVVAVEGELVVRALPDGRRLRAFPTEGLDALLVTPVGDLLVARRDVLDVLDVETGEVLRSLEEFGVAHLAWSPGTPLVLAAEGEALLWDPRDATRGRALGGLVIDPHPLADAEPLGRYAIEPRGFDVGALSPDGRRAYAPSTDGVWVWDTETGEGIDLIPFGDDTPVSLAVAPDGRRLFVGTASGVVLSFELTGAR